jgi:hypothetical protein
MYCEVVFTAISYSIGDTFYTTSNPDTAVEYLTHFYSSDTMKIVGLAVSAAYDWNGAGLVEMGLYVNEKTTPIAHVSGRNYAEEIYLGWVPMDSNYVILTIPGRYLPRPMHIGDGLFLCFFENGETVDICGDFYVGIYLNSPGWDKLPPMYHLNENHEPPYNFPQRAFKLRTLGGEMREYVSNRFIPMLFPIIEPPCPEVDSVRVMVDSTGCLVAEWDSLPYQEQWVVHYQRPGMTVIDTVNRCLWRRNVFDTTSYTISVRSRCTNLRSLTWSDWCTTVKGDTTAAIPNPQLSPLTFHLYPNPSTGDVTIFIPAPFLTPHSSFLTVFDASGREVIPPTPLTSHLSHLTFHLPDGIYLVRVTTPHGTATQKLTIAR